MSSGQGMMLSDPPNNSGTNNGQSGYSIGNYKGVMLCNRPFAGVAAAARKAEAQAGKDGFTPFKCGVVAAELGQCKLGLGEKVLHHKKKNNALTKHKKWLANLQKTKEYLEEAFLEQEAEREMKKKRFMSREAKMRQIVKKTVGFPNSGKNINSNSESQQELTKPEIDVDCEIAEAKTTTNKPMWALTAESAEKECERQEDEEVDELLDFTKSLDFEKYIDDMEVKAMIKQVKSRISNLEAEIADDEKREADDLARAAIKGEAKAHTFSTENLAKLEGNSDVVKDDDIISVVHSVMDDNSKIKNVHSVQSLKNIAKISKEKIEEEDKQDTGSKIEPPKIVKIDESDGSRLMHSKTPSHLPYLNRNPAV